MAIRFIHRGLRSVAIFSMLFTSAMAHAVVINELRIDQSGADTDEYIELYGDAGESLDNLTYLVIGDQGSNQGYIEAVVSLSGYQLAADGFFLIAESSFSLGPDVDLITSLNFENNDNVTHLLVKNFTGSLRDDIDSNDDGVIDNMLWSDILDSVALLASISGGDLVYSANKVGPKNDTSPAHIFRSVDQSGGWQVGEADIGLSDSPRLVRSASRHVSVPEPSSLLLLLAGLLSMLGLKKRLSIGHPLGNQIRYG